LIEIGWGGSLQYRDKVPRKPFFERIKMTDCPCEECLVRPLCRNKTYANLYTTCNIISDYLYIDTIPTKKVTKLHRNRAKRLEKVLRPISWSLGRLSDNGYLINDKRKNI
jgi:hypothetical protein